MSDSGSTARYFDLSSIGFPGYRVGDDGTVWTAWRFCKRGEGKGRGSASEIGDAWVKLKPNLINKYYSVSLKHEGRVVQRRVHRLVLLAFVGPQPGGTEACHDPDRDPANNRLDNLRWDTKKANQADRIKHGTEMRGEKHFATTLTDDKVRQIRLDHAAGRTCRQLGAEHKKHYATIAKIVKRASWSHVT